MTSHDNGRSEAAGIGLVGALALAAVLASWARSPSVFPEWTWLTDVLLVAAVVGACVAARATRTVMPVSPLLGLAGLVVLLSALAAPDAGAAIASAAGWLRLVIAAFTAAILATMPQFARRAAWALAAAGAALSIHAALQVFVIHPALARETGLPQTVISALLDGRGNAVFLLPAHLGAFLALSLAAASSLALEARGGSSRLALMLALLSVAGLFVAASMGGALLAGLALASLAFFGLSGRQGVGLLIVACVLPILLAAPSRMRREAEIAREDPGSARVANWASAARLIREQPVLGSGGGSFATEHERVRAPLENDARHAHEGYLEAAAEHGIGLLPLLAALVAAILRRSWSAARARAADDRVDLPSAALDAGAVTVLAHALIDFGWSDPAWGVPAAFLVGACLAARGVVPESGDDSPPSRWRSHAAILAAGGVLLMVSVPASISASLERRALAAGEEARHADAVVLLARARRLEPWDGSLAVTSAAAHLALAGDAARAAPVRAEHLEAAVAAARAGVLASPRSATARLMLARSLAASGRRLEALSQASRAAQLAPHRAAAIQLRDLLAAQASR